MQKVNILLRLPKTVHTELAKEAKQYSMSMNTLIIHKIMGLKLKQLEKSVKQ